MPGFRSIILRIPEEQLCVVVLSNVLLVQPGPIANHLADIMVLDDR